MMEFAWLIPLFPLVSFLILLAAGRRLKTGSAWLGTGLMLVSFLLSIFVLAARLQHGTYKAEGTWLTIGDLHITAGFEITPLNALMLITVTLVSLLVHMYSRVYMEDDERLHVFFAYLGLFTFAMLELVITTNLLQLYLFWELVGLGSFLLIGFYFKKEPAKRAAKKAFIMTRIGDIGLLTGMLLLFSQTGSFEYDAIFQFVGSGSIPADLLTLIAILIFAGAVGKSGQFPLHTWLPDAMEGPTPVSALIHAATMVAAGVYLTALMYPLFEASGTALTVVAVTGGFTAIFAASIGLVQNDIKRVLAYSTVSQLGFMMLALGSGGYTAGVFHLFTHAFFKALLFLAAGSVIHAVHTQDIRKMGGLWKKLPWTGPLFLTGALSISGFPLFSGFFSKDEILASVWLHGNPYLFWLAAIASFFTAFYMFRLFFLVFGKRTEETAAAISPDTQAEVRINRSAESGVFMVAPIAVLGILAVAAGFLNTPWMPYLSEWLQPDEVHAAAPAWIMLMSVLVSLAGMFLAYAVYEKAWIRRDAFSRRIPMIHQVLLKKYFIDECYQMTVLAAVRVFSYTCQMIERFVVETAVKGTAAFIQGLGSAGSRLQNGQTQSYAAAAFLGLALLAAVWMLTGGMQK
ncbi:NADH-quinone oxidoreductase subunit L [Bacillus sp. FJAT-42376]|uniref:NADH-quinone oxidoreductase subunit L n=1 Tax=Bacillus sp. FJAT-42376 TaxID=2014076 RepID=UPI000F4F2D71|nr:NADH-quinone oxidoreductase subunit L [Bacillus sp. FJAT-42376]AZB40886.1 NADH-quinone oxidoreductase subunit L [Bacillus sp. FJAT-42376]